MNGKPSEGGVSDFLSPMVSAGGMTKSKLFPRRKGHRRKKRKTSRRT